MTALAQERLTGTAGPYPARGTYGIKANTRNFKGGLVALDSAGRAMPAGLISTGALFCVGKASHTLDNRTGSELGGGADAADQEVEYGVFAWENSAAGDAITVAHVGLPCYAVDDNVVALTSAGGTRPFAGIVSEVRDGKVWVYSSPAVAAAAQAVPGDDIQTVQAGTSTLVAGVATINTGITITANSRILITRKTPAGTFADGGHDAPSADRVVGGPGVGTFVIRARAQDGTAQTGDTATVDWAIIG